MYKVECDRIRLSAGPALESGVEKGLLSRAVRFLIFRCFSRGGYHKWWEIDNRKVGCGCDKVERGGGLGQMSRKCVEELVYSRVGDQWLGVGETNMENTMVRSSIDMKCKDLLTCKYRCPLHSTFPGGGGGGGGEED